MIAYALTIAFFGAAVVATARFFVTGHPALLAPILTATAAALLCAHASMTWWVHTFARLGVLAGPVAADRIIVVAAASITAAALWRAQWNLVQGAARPDVVRAGYAHFEPVMTDADQRAATIRDTEGTRPAEWVFRNEFIGYLEKTGQIGPVTRAAFAA